MCEKGQVLNASQLNTFLEVVPECFIFSPSSFCSYLACIAGSHSFITLLGGNLVLQPPGGDIPLLFT